MFCKLFVVACKACRCHAEDRYAEKMASAIVNPLSLRNERIPFLHWTNGPAAKPWCVVLILVLACWPCFPDLLSWGDRLLFSGTCFCSPVPFPLRLPLGTGEALCSLSISFDRPNCGASNLVPQRRLNRLPRSCRYAAYPSEMDGDARRFSQRLHFLVAGLCVWWMSLSPPPPETLLRRPLVSPSAGGLVIFRSFLHFHERLRGRPVGSCLEISLT